jgi:hypothetical protein
MIRLPSLPPSAAPTWAALAWSIAALLAIALIAVGRADANLHDLDRRVTSLEVDRTQILIDLGAIREHIGIPRPQPRP